ncbi:MAG: GNAT family N-acetyltransferase [Aequorivita sp.]|nr:GNAT family N-acetyltransferase [Aequorivita sp.]MBF30635.1 GNAT family N-acetyltransferase [Aequorivita sp.]|tara:strand:- start:30722 stop:31282 length:561 start_codon:yes stop_codon:yes gene_type:complete
MNIRGKKIELKAIEIEDLSLLHKWSNDPEINYMLGGWHFPSSLTDQEKWYNSLALSSLNQRFAIHTSDLGLIGMANLVEINWKDRNAFHGMLLGEKDLRGKGYGVDTIMAISRYAFEELGLMRLDSTIISNNEASIAVYTKRCGWQIEGVKKNAYFRRNKWWNQLVIGITRDDYFNLLKDNNYWDE